MGSPKQEKGHKQKPALQRKRVIFIMVPPARFEHAAPGLGILSYKVPRVALGVYTSHFYLDFVGFMMSYFALVSPALLIDFRDRLGTNGTATQKEEESESRNPNPPSQDSHVQRETGPILLDQAHG